MKSFDKTKLYRTFAIEIKEIVPLIKLIIKDLELC